MWFWTSGRRSWLACGPIPSFPEDFSPQARLDGLIHSSTLADGVYALVKRTSEGYSDLQFGTRGTVIQSFFPLDFTN